MIIASIVIFILLFIILGLVYQFMFDLFTVFLLLSIIFYIGYLAVAIVLKRKKKKMSHTVKSAGFKPFQPKVQTKEQKPAMHKQTGFQQPMKDPEMQKLVDFIVKNKNQGYKDKIIRDALLKQGWDAVKVEQAFRASK